MTVTVAAADLEAIRAHACEAYPDECCGMIITRDGREEVVRVTNIQNQLHAIDPGQFPRTARTAYHMGREHLPIMEDETRGLLQIRAFYHSHVDHDVYFSPEDRIQAFAGWDEPTYPQAAQIVVSVYARTVKAVGAFVWDPARQEFVEVPLVARA